MGEQQEFIIAVDAMGGDHGPVVTVPACLDFLARFTGARVMLVGKQEALQPELANAPTGLLERIQVIDAREVVGMDESPALAMRNKKDSSMRRAIDQIKDGVAHVAVSAGNTGALMATARFVLKMLPGIDRPAICGALPTIDGHVHMLDLGANVDCSPEHLQQFAIMGATLVEALEHRTPTVGLLNIGEEDIKGNDLVKRAAELIRAADVNFVGNVEGDGIYKGAADVIVCDGFVGNVALKTSEGLAQMIGTALKQEFNRSIWSKLVAALAMPVLKRFKARMDHRVYNGAALLGLRGVVIKSHGSADRLAFYHALVRGYEAARGDVLNRISGHLQKSANDAGGEVAA